MSVFVWNLHACSQQYISIHSVLPRFIPDTSPIGVYIPSLKRFLQPFKRFAIQHNACQNQNSVTQDKHHFHYHSLPQKAKTRGTLKLFLHLFVLVFVSVVYVQFWLTYLWPAMQFHVPIVVFSMLTSL